MTMKRISGFTLLELMMTLVVVAILLGIGAPSLEQFIKNNRLVAVTNELVSSMQVARSAAIQYSGVACVCPTTMAGSAVPSCDVNNNWEAGWMAFIDVNDDAVYTPGGANGDVLLKVWDGAPYSGAMTVRSSSAGINAVDYVRFNGRGTPVTLTGVSLQGMFKICDDRGLMHPDGVDALGKGIAITASGSIRTTRDPALIVSCL